MPKRATQVILNDQEQEALVQLTKCHRSEQQHMLRARIVLAAVQGCSNTQIARELAINVDTMRLWRDRWVGLQGIGWETRSYAERLQDAPRPGTPPKITAEQRCQNAVVACGAPLSAGRPISQWTGARNCRRTQGQRYCGADLPTACFLPAEVWELQPHRFRYWLTIVADSQREAKIVEGCQVYARTTERAKQGERTISLDELTGVQALERKAVLAILQIQGQKRG